MEKEIELEMTFNKICKNGVNCAFLIVDELMNKTLEHEPIPVNNTYNLYVTKEIRFFIQEWLDLWGQNFDDSYTIIGNTIFIIISDVNKIEKI